MKTKTEECIRWHREHGTRFLDALPDGWRYVEGATTAPAGWKWAATGSFFGGGHEHALIRH